MASDACPSGYRAIMGEEYISGSFPKHLQSSNIALLEMLAVLAALRTWTKDVKGKYFWVYVDNEAVTIVMNTGASREESLQNALREIAMLAALNSFMIKAKHIRGVDNRIPDWLSRWKEPEARKKFLQYTENRNLKQINTPASIIDPVNN